MAGVSSCFASFLTYPSKQQLCSARAIHHSLLRSWHQVRFAAQSRKADELARNGHSLLGSTQKLDRPTATSLWVRWSNTTYSPGDSVVSSLMRMLAEAKSLTGSNLRKLPAGSFFRISNGECMGASRFAWCCKAN